MLLLVSLIVPPTVRSEIYKSIAQSSSLTLLMVTDTTTVRCRLPKGRFESVGYSQPALQESITGHGIASRLCQEGGYRKMLGLPRFATVFLIACFYRISPPPLGAQASNRGSEVAFVPPAQANSF